MFNNIYHSKPISDYAFLVTGGAGFIGSNIVDYIMMHNPKLLRVIDNLSTGSIDNIKEHVGKQNFQFLKEDICDYHSCLKATENIDFVIHQAALGSVPRSIKNPLDTNNTNITGFINIAYASKENNVKRIVYASSSSVYGDDTTLPKKEQYIGKPLSPYAVSKHVNEQYAYVFNKIYGLKIVGLRYFNVFGPKQNPKGPYAAVIPIFINNTINNVPSNIFGDGNQVRDFTFVENVVQANIKVLFSENQNIFGRVYNVAFGSKVSINDLFFLIAKMLNNRNIKPNYCPERMGDIKNSMADIGAAKNDFNYYPLIPLEEGLKITVNLFKEYFNENIR